MILYIVISLKIVPFVPQFCTSLYRVLGVSLAFIVIRADASGRGEVVLM
jgi:hypothetical protein